MILYLVRHGETDFNKLHIIQGRTLDEPLNTSGEEQMHTLKHNLPDDFEVIFSSPLKRVIASAQIIAIHTGKKILTRDELLEQDFGSLVGKTWKDISEGEDLKERNRNQAYDYRPYGGEAVADVEKRIRDFFAYAKGSGYERALVVTSQGIIRLVYKMLLGRQDVEVSNASVHTFEI